MQREQAPAALPTEVAAPSAAASGDYIFLRVSERAGCLGARTSDVYLSALDFESYVDPKSALDTVCHGGQFVPTLQAGSLRAVELRDLSAAVAEGVIDFFPFLPYNMRSQSRLLTIECPAASHVAARAKVQCYFPQLLGLDLVDCRQ